MEQYFEILSSCGLFSQISRDEMSSMLSCLGAKAAEFAKGDPIFLEGEPAQFVGVVLSGAVQIVRDDYYGNRSVITVAHPGELFAEVFSCAGVEAFPVSAIAQIRSKVMLLDCKHMLTVCSNACGFHARLVQNLLQAVSQKSLALSRKISFMSQKTTRQKLMAYLLDQAKTHGSPEFTIPYDRQSLADFLGVERSAMSAEISKLRKDGILDCKGSHFYLKQPLV